MRGTRLWTEPHSPLISGRSRRARSFWAEWLMGGVLAVVVSVLVIAYLVMPDGVAGWCRLGTSAALMIVGALAGAAVGVVVARGMGWVRPWLSAAIVGGIGSLGVAAYVVYGGSGVFSR